MGRLVGSLLGIAVGSADGDVGFAVGSADGDVGTTVLGALENVGAWIGTMIG